MAFYQDAPGKKKVRTDYASLGSWDEEGSHYHDKGENRKSGKKDSAPRSASHSSLEKGKKAVTGTGRFKPSRRREDFSGTDRKSGERYGSGRQDQGKSRHTDRARFPREEVRTSDGEREDYRDYEFRSAPDERSFGSEQEAGNILCGRNPIREAFRSGRDIEKLLVQKGELSGSAREIVQTAKANKVMVQEVEKSRLDEIAPHHQGLIAFASAYAYAEVEDMLAEAEKRGEDPFLILLDSVTDPHNLGAIIRSAECAGAHGVIVPQHRSVGLTPSAVKASAGAVEYIKVARVTNLNRTIEDLRKKGIWVYALAMDGEDFEKVDFRGGTALVIGAEGEGISRLTREKCDQTVALPMRGKLDSLNASVAAGIMMYRVLSCRRK